MLNKVLQTKLNHIFDRRTAKPMKPSITMRTEQRVHHSKSWKVPRILINQHRHDLFNHNNLSATLRSPSWADDPFDCLSFPRWTQSTSQQYWCPPYLLADAFSVLVSRTLLTGWQQWQQLRQISNCLTLHCRWNWFGSVARIIRWIFFSFSPPTSRCIVSLAKLRSAIPLSQPYFRTEFCLSKNTKSEFIERGGVFVLRHAALSVRTQERAAGSPSLSTFPFKFHILLQPALLFGRDRRG